jgi:hypothetical protein
LIPNLLPLTTDSKFRGCDAGANDAGAKECKAEHKHAEELMGIHDEFDGSFKLKEMIVITRRDNPWIGVLKFEGVQGWAKLLMTIEWIINSLLSSKRRPPRLLGAISTRYIQSTQPVEPCPADLKRLAM